MNFDFEVIIKLHPVSNFIITTNSIHDELIQKNSENIEFVFPGNVEKYITEKNEDVIYFLTNDKCDMNNITSDCKDFIKNLLNPTEQINNLVRELVDNDFYNIIHFRLGDKYIVEGKTLIDEQFFNEILKLIENNLDDKNVIMSDSSEFKKQILAHPLSNQENIKIFDLDIGHIGYSTDLEKIKNSIVEFIIITKAQQIKTHSVYAWISGYVQWVSVIYDVPLKKI